MGLRQNSFIHLGTESIDSHTVKRRLTISPNVPVGYCYINVTKVEATTKLPAFCYDSTYLEILKLAFMSCSFWIKCHP